jgi:hypothetical protein
VNYRVLHSAFGQFRAGDVIPHAHTLLAGGPDGLISLGTIEPTTDPITVDVPAPKPAEPISNSQVLEGLEQANRELDVARQQISVLESELKTAKNERATFEAETIRLTRELGEQKTISAELHEQVQKLNKDIDDLTKPATPQ